MGAPVGVYEEPIVYDPPHIFCGVVMLLPKDIVPDVTVGPPAMRGKSPIDVVIELHPSVKNNSHDIELLVGEGAAGQL